MATIQKEIRKRGIFGKIIKWSFILFNILMIAWLFSYFNSVSEVTEATTSDAGKAGAVIGGTIGTGFLLFIWAMGSIVLGILTMMTRGQKTIITEELEK